MTMSHKFIEWMISVKLTVCVGSYCNIMQIRPDLFILMHIFYRGKTYILLKKKKFKIINVKIPDTWEVWEFTSLGSFEKDPKEENITKRINTNIVICFPVLVGGLEILKKLNWLLLLILVLAKYHFGQCKRDNK
jgi:hypothetical protein